jgi:hypothetical protein
MRIVRKAVARVKAVWLMVFADARKRKPDAKD